ncbi:hypothetical protein DN069_33445 [Streptacidiphilus pinicola]|uniref:Uncharacterized protein n=1 Tax=Streptacidiphilus pinicola TaxID=2219663 RepID=A0A2X0ID32_9ACTN|nr:hypothetical protein [Streptacidiphilus pinicola]RAG81301.1 hypothetical protein DN069_33445 [Streptacidiphilus pinicola]
MNDDLSSAAHHHAHVVVHPVQDDPMTGPYRRVDILGEHVGKAYDLGDVAEFCRRAGLDELDLQSDSMVDWQGGGPEVWE